MNAPARHAPLQRASSPVPLSAGQGRRRQRAHRLTAALLGWLRFALMAAVGVLGVWLLVLLFE